MTWGRRPISPRGAASPGTRSCRRSIPYTASGERRAEMANRFCVSLTHAKDNSDKATVAFVVANAALGSGKETLVFLSVEAVRLSQPGYADDIREEGFAPRGELMDNFAKG